MKNNLYSVIIALFFVLSATVTLTPNAEAACSYNGYFNSTGKCNNSYSYTTTNTYQYHNAQIEAQILQLLALLEQLRDLQAQLGYHPGSSGAVDVTTRSASNIADEDATLRGEIDFNNEDEATVYFQFGKSSTNLKYDTTHYVLDEDNDDEVFEHGITDLDEDTRYYFRAVAEDEDGRRDYGSILDFTTDDNGSSNNDDEPQADVDTAENIKETSAELNGSVDMNDFRNGVVFFVYGEDDGQIEDVEDDYDKYDDVDVDGDDLRKVRVDSDLDGDEDYTRTVSGLDSDTRIYYSICVEYEDDDDDQVLTCSSVEDFTTDGRSSNNDEPQIDTEGSSRITDDSARITGSADMNDFENGTIFFVYGEDKSQVDDIADDYDTYNSIDEDGDNLQKVKVKDHVDDIVDFYANISGLYNDTDIYYAACVEYEDEDNDNMILCGDTEDFTTDN